MNDFYINFGIKIFTKVQEYFFILSLLALLLAFIIRLYYKKSDFEYLKLIAGIIVFIYGLHFTLLEYKDTKREKINNQIILLKTSSLNENEKKYYMEKEQKKIEILDGSIISNLNNMLLGAGSILLCCMILIIFRDFFFQNIWNMLGKILSNFFRLLFRFVDAIFAFIKRR